MQLDRRLLTLAAVLLAVCAAAAPAQKPGAARCSESPLEEGPLAFGAGLRLGPPAKFEDGDGLASGRCFPLYAGETLVAWVGDVREAGGRLLVWRCTEDPSVTDVEPGARGGYVGEGYEEMTPAGGAGRFAFKEVDLPLWGHFSNPSFCGSAVAYWGTEDTAGGKTRVYAVLFDAGSMRLVGKRLLGAVFIEADTPDFFPTPAWHESGAAATFNPDEERGLGLRSLTLRRR